MGTWAARDEELLTAAREDAEAFAEFYRRYERPMLGFFMTRTRDPELAADLTAEVFAAALIACRRYRPGKAPAAVWLFGIAHHKLIDSRRRRVVADRARRQLRMAPIELLDDDIERIESAAGGVLELLDELPADQRQAVMARVIDDQSYDQIAGELACSPAVVRKRVSRGLGRLRERLEETTP